MNNIVKKITEIIKSEIKINMPNINESDLEENGKVYYMNGQNGTLFDYTVNEKLSDFMCFYKDGRFGIIKLRINKNGTAHIYLYHYGEITPFMDKELSNEFTKDEIFNLAVILNIIMDMDGIFDRSISDYNTAITVTDEDKEQFTEECKEMYDCVNYYKKEI